MITIHYFASIRESMQRSEQELELPVQVTTVAGLIDELVKLEPSCAAILQDTQVLVAVDQSVVGLDSPLSGSEEVAFFPPMTGG
jgi:molybdopterin synthase sulfur carrier subunit